MSHRIYAMDTYFFTSFGVYEFDARCEIVKELGFDATYLTARSDASWAEVPRLANVKSKHGLDVAAVYATLEMEEDDKHAWNLRILDLIEKLEGCDHIELSIRSSNPALKCSDPAGDATVRRWLDRYVEAAARRKITISLYPHLQFWLERTEDAVRLCRAYDHPQLRTAFCGFHWFAADGTNLSARLEEAAPWLRTVNLCGSRRARNPNGGYPATIEPLDSGELDNFAVLGALQKIGYRGMIGFQGYSIGGDVYANLRRSMAAYRDMEQRLMRHPHWARMR